MDAYLFPILRNILIIDRHLQDDGGPRERIDAAHGAGTAQWATIHRGGRGESLPEAAAACAAGNLPHTPTHRCSRDRNVRNIISQIDHEPRALPIIGTTKRFEAYD